MMPKHLDLPFSRHDFAGSLDGTCVKVLQLADPQRLVPVAALGLSAPSESPGAAPDLIAEDDKVVLRNR